MGQRFRIPQGDPQGLWPRQTVRAAAPIKGKEMTRINKKSGQRGCNSECPEWRRCKAGRLWMTGPMPCEKLLPWEVENDFDGDSSPSLWTIPIQVRVNVEAIL